MSTNKTQPHSSSRRQILVRSLAVVPLLTMAACQGTGLGGINIGSPDEDDSEISVKVRAALRQRGLIPQERIRVSTDENNAVRLSGIVTRDAARLAAEDAARGVAGVSGVVNALIVQ